MTIEMMLCLLKPTGTSNSDGTGNNKFTKLEFPSFVTYYYIHTYISMYLYRTSRNNNSQVTKTGMK